MGAEVEFPCFHLLLNKIILGKWQGHQDSNPGPTDLESVALPTELYPYIVASLYLKSRHDANGEDIYNVRIFKCN